MSSALQDAFDSPQCKAWAACRVVRDDVSDEDVISLYEYCDFYSTSQRDFFEIMRNIYSVDITQSFSDWNPLFVTFYNMMRNHVLKQLSLLDISLDEMADYRYGLGRNLLCLASLLTSRVITTTQMRDILADLLKYTNIGVEFEDYILRSTRFDIADNSELSVAIDSVLMQQQQLVDEFRSGKEKVIGSMIGMVMKRIKCDPIELREMLLHKLKK